MYDFLLVIYSSLHLVPVSITDKAKYWLKILI